MMSILRFTTLRDDYPEEEECEWAGVIREYDQFKASVHDTLEKITHELARLGVEEGILELDVAETDIRRVRGRFSNVADPYSPRVRLTFSHHELGPLKYPCGTY